MMQHKRLIIVRHKKLNLRPPFCRFPEPYYVMLMPRTAQILQVNMARC